MGHFSTKTTANTVNDREGAAERAKLNVTLIFCSVCVYRPDTMTLQAGAQMLLWPLVVWFTVPAHTDPCTQALSLNNMAAVLETLTKVSVEASKQRNERGEKTQSTRQLTPVQNSSL